MSGKWAQADAHDLALAISELADKVLYWKDRALRAETAERMFATEVYTKARRSKS